MHTIIIIIDLELRYKQQYVLQHKNRRLINTHHTYKLLLVVLFKIHIQYVINIAALEQYDARMQYYVLNIAALKQYDA